MNEKKNSFLLTNFHDLYVLEDKTSQKKFPSVWMSGCTYVRGLFMWTKSLLKELADPNEISWVSSMCEM